MLNKSLPSFALLFAGLVKAQDKDWNKSMLVMPSENFFV